MSGLHETLHGTISHLKELETHARQLQNQNLADVAKAAHHHVTQLAEHADIDALHTLMTKGHAKADEPKVGPDEVHAHTKADELKPPAHRRRGPE